MALALHNHRQLNLTDPNMNKNVFHCSVFSNTVYCVIINITRNSERAPYSQSRYQRFILFPTSTVYNATAVNNSTFSFYLLDLAQQTDLDHLPFTSNRKAVLRGSHHSQHELLPLFLWCTCDAPVRGRQGLPKYFKRVSGSITLLFLKTTCITSKLWNSVYL